METRENIERHLNVLCKEIRARPTGSEANHTAVEYACREFERAGLDVLRQEFDCMDWVDNGGILTVGGKAVPMAAAPYSLPCSVQGELLCIRSLEELRSLDYAAITNKLLALHDFGKIVVNAVDACDLKVF